MIGRNGERGSRISALAARHDDDDDDFRLTATESLIIRRALHYANGKTITSFARELNPTGVGDIHIYIYGSIYIYIYIYIYGSI